MSQLCSGITKVSTSAVVFYRLVVAVMCAVLLVIPIFPTAPEGSTTRGNGSQSNWVVTRSSGGVPVRKSAGETKTEKGVAQTRKPPEQLCFDFTLKKRRQF